MSLYCYALAIPFSVASLIVGNLVFLAMGLALAVMGIIIEKEQA